MPGLPARHQAGIRRHHPARRQAAVRLCRGDGPEGHGHHPQGLRRRLLRHVQQAHSHRCELRLADGRNCGDGAGRRGEHPLQARARQPPPTPTRLRAERVAEFREKFANPYVAASRGFVDEVIQPRQTRGQADRRPRRPRNQARPQSPEEAREHPAVTRREGAHRQPRRDRRPHHPRLPRDGAADGRRLLRLRSGRAPRARRGQAVPHRPERGSGQLSEHRRPSSRRRARSGADAVHPGYGFLAENAAFARACARRRADVHRAVARRHRADGQQDRGARPPRSRPACRSSPAPNGRSTRTRRARTRSRAAAAQVGYPLMVKAVAGGGGKGMRVVESRRRPRLAPCRPRDRRPGRRSATPRSTSSGGSSRPRHIEIQLLGDHHGTVVPFVERECSIQRRHQKVVEESPSLAVSQPLRERMAAAAAAVARAVGYTNAGTIEFLLDEDGSFYFLEMNTRLQVEHPVTEMVDRASTWCSGRSASRRGERLDIDPGAGADAARPRHRVPHLRRGSRPGLHAVAGPDPRRCARASGPGVRDDGGVAAGYTVPVYLRLDDRQADRLGRLARRGHRAHVARARASTRSSASGPRSRSSCG